MASSSTSTAAVVLRGSTPADLPAILRLLEASSLPTVGVVEALRDFIVAESGSEVVGVVGIETCGDRYALLRSTAVVDAWRVHGIGRRLVERAIAEAESRALEALYLLTTTAEHYFPSFGFTAINRDVVPEEV